MNDDFYIEVERPIVSKNEHGGEEGCRKNDLIILNIN
jgi:hypothetical protein